MDGRQAGIFWKAGCGLRRRGWLAGKKGAAMATVAIWVLAVLVFELLVWFYAEDSTDGFDSPEWERRRTWRAGR